MPTVYLIDASPYIFRAYYSLPVSITTPDGHPANAVYGFTDFLIQIVKKAAPSHVAVAFDGSLTTSFRNDIYPEYKAQRALPPPELEAQQRWCLQAAEALGMATFIDDRFEADDLIASLGAQLEGHERVVVSSDKDLAQLVSPEVTVWDFARDRRYDVAAVHDHFGVAPEQIVDLLALMGDAVDNIPGVKGIGPKTATALLRAFGSLEELYGRLEAGEAPEVRGARSVVERLLANREIAFLSQRLATLSCEAPVRVELEMLQYDGAVRAEVEPLFTRFGFERMLARIPLWQS